LIRRAVLPNGIRIIARELRSAPVVALNLWVGTGSSDDPDGLGGTAHFIEHMLFREGTGRAALNLAQTVHDAGGYLNAETGCDHTMYHQVVPSSRWKDVLGPAISAVIEPAFREDDVDSERGVVIEEARSRDSDPGAFVWHRLTETALKGRPCGRPVVGTPQSVTRAGADTLRRHHAEHYVGGNIVQVIVGDLDAQEAIEFASPLLEEVPAGAPDRAGATGVARADGTRGLSYNGAVEQPYVAMAFEGPHALHEDVPALDALCGVLGVGRSSRLWRVLRTGRGIVSDIGCGLAAFRDDGLIAVRAVSLTPHAEDVVEAVLTETERLRREPPDAEEMRKNLRRLEAAYVLEHETADSIAGVLGYFETLGDYRWSEEYVDRLASVGAEDLARVSETYLRPERATVVLYRPGDPSEGPAEIGDEVARRAGVASATLGGAVRERRPAWSTAGGFTRPDLMRESPPEPCSRHRVAAGTLVTCRSAALPIVSVTIGFRGGFVEEGPTEAGLTYLAEKMAPLGTLSRTADQVFGSIEGLGSSLASAVERDGFGVGCTVLSKHLREAISVMADVVVNASFPEDMLARAKRQVLSEMIETRDSPLRRVLLELLPLSFPGGAYGRPIRGMPDALETYERSQVADWHRKNCTQRAMTACLVGDVDDAAAAEIIEEAFGGLPRGSEREPGGPEALDGSRPSGASESVLTGSPQSVVAVSVGGPVGGTVDAVAARVVLRALSMMGGRLWRNLRERPPHAYYVGGTLLAYARGGASVAYATSAPGNEAAVAEGLLSEFQQVARAGLEADELERTKRHLAGSLDISLVRGAARSSSYAMAEVMGAGYEHIAGLARRVRDVTGDDVARVASEYMDPELGHAEVILRGEPPRS